MLSVTITTKEIDEVHAIGNARARFPLNYNNKYIESQWWPRLVVEKERLSERDFRNHWYFIPFFRKFPFGSYPFAGLHPPEVGVDAAEI